MCRKKSIIIGVTIFALVFAAIIFSKNDTFYHQKIRFERISKKIFYLIQNQTAQVIDSITDSKITEIKVPFHKQEHSVTCETAALRMALNYHKTGVTEEELLEKLVFDTKEPKSPDNIWGDPDKGFVGDIDGSVFLGTGYGVYEKPIWDLAMQYRPALIINNIELEKILETVKSGHPVIVWGLLSRRKTISWMTQEGKKIEAHPGEHARVITGFYGTTSNPTKIILMDPIYGKIRMSKERFLSDWKVLENRAVAVY